MTLFDGINATCTVTPMSADHHAYMQRMAEWARNNPPDADDITCCMHCQNAVALDEEWDNGDDIICVECADERLASQHADAADRKRDERWADQWESAHDAG